MTDTTNSNNLSFTEAGAPNYSQVAGTVTGGSAATAAHTEAITLTRNGLTTIWTAQAATATAAQLAADITAGVQDAHWHVSGTDT